MRYAKLRSMDISNGEGVGISLFVQGCPYHCKGCFNPETWDFNGGKEFTQEVIDKIFWLLDREHIKRISILGGEPLADQNITEVTALCKSIKERFPNKKIWIYTGGLFEDIKDKEIMSYIDVLVDGPFVYELKDFDLDFRGSSNQRIIDINKSILNKEVIGVQHV